jgi:hypothetical protein
MCAGLLAVPAAARAQALAPQTIWINDHARFVIESIDADGKLTGTYENFGPNFTCAGQVFPVTGWTDGERISYAVRRKIRATAARCKAGPATFVTASFLSRLPRLSRTAGRMSS